MGGREEGIGSGGLGGRGLVGGGGGRRRMYDMWGDTTSSS